MNFMNILVRKIESRSLEGQSERPYGYRGHREINHMSKVSRISSPS